MEKREVTGTDISDKFKKALEKIGTEKYVLRLYVAGMSPRSIEAIENLKRICDENMPDRYRLDIIDIYQQPIFAKEGQIVAAPTLIKELPLPIAKLVGNMSDKERVLVGLDLHVRGNGFKKRSRSSLPEAINGQVKTGSSERER